MSRKWTLLTIAVLSLTLFGIVMSMTVVEFREGSLEGTVLSMLLAFFVLVGTIDLWKKVYRYYR